MADFEKAFRRMLANEGGLSLSDVKNDRGGQTYAGIARKHHPNWPGWKIVDRGELPPLDLVRNFYRREFWNAVRGDHIEDQGIAESVFDFAVNASPRVSIMLAQLVAGAAPDGKIGPKTLAALNASGPVQIQPQDAFHPLFALAKIKRYADICNRDRSQRGFLLGWINRTLKELEK